MSADFPSNQRKERYVTPMDVQERTLKVTNYSRNVTESLLRELFSQGGPVRKIVFKEQFSYVEFEDAESVAYCLALFDGVELFGDRLQLAPKIGSQSVYNYYNILKQYEQQFAMNPAQWWAKFGDPNQPCPTHICCYSAYRQPATNYDYYNPMQGSPAPQMRSPRMGQPRNFPQPGQWSGSQNQMAGQPSSSYHQQARSAFDLRAERRPRHFESVIDFETHLQMVKNRAWTRNDRNNNERKIFKTTYNDKRNFHGKRPFPESPPSNNKRIRKHQSF